MPLSNRARPAYPYSTRRFSPGARRHDKICNRRLTGPAWPARRRAIGIDDAPLPTLLHSAGNATANAAFPQSFALHARLATPPCCAMNSASLTRVILLLLLAINCFAAPAQQLKTRNVFLIISDGLRWQEV